MSKTKKATTPKTQTAAHDHDHDHAGHDHNHGDQSSLPIAPNSQVTVKIAWKTVEPVYQQHLTRVAQNLKAPGFRQGKVPPAMAEGLIDRSKFLEQVLQEVLPPAYAEVVKKENKLPLTQPEIEPVQMEKGKDWEFIVYFAERPIFKLGKYQDAIKKAKPGALKEIQDAEKALKEQAKKQAETKTDEKAPEAPKETELSDTRKEDIRIKHIFKALIEAIQPQVPELLVRQEVNRELQRLLDQLSQFKLSVDDYLKSRNLTPEQLRQEYIGVAVSSLQIEFILAEIAKEEKIKVEDKEIDETLDKVAGGKLTPEQRQNSEYRSYLFSTLTKQKVMKQLLTI